MMLFSSEPFSTEEERLPTLKQYVTKMKGKKLPVRFHVTKIWYPNKYPNYSVETDKFRLSVSSKSPMGRALAESTIEIFDNEIAVAVIIEVSEAQRCSAKFVQTKEKGYWSVIGNDNPLGMVFDHA